MSKNNPDELNFSSLFADAKPVTHDKYIPSRGELKTRDKNLANKMKDEKGSKDKNRQHASVALSDEYEAHWPEHQALKYMRDISNLNCEHQAASNPIQALEKKDEFHLRKDLIKQLQRGLIPPDIELDVHGLTKQQAKEELIAVIYEAMKSHCVCINIIHGHGNGILKQKIPNWLVQHPDVAGFVQAPKAYGGKAGILVLIGNDFSAVK